MKEVTTREQVPSWLVAFLTKGGHMGNRPAVQSGVVTGEMGS